MDPFSKRKYIDQTSKYIVCGYIRNYQKLLPLHNAYYNIPNLVQLICLNYYFTVNPTFYTTKHGEYMQFEENLFRMINTTNVWSTCVLNEEITDKECNIFNLHILWKKRAYSFFMGYIVSTIDESIKDWDDHIGYKRNSKNSVGILVESGYLKFKLCDKNNTFAQLSYSADEGFKEGDSFILSFNFKANQLIIYHNDIIADKLSLNHYKKIQPAFTAYKQGEEIEITYEFE